MQGTIQPRASPISEPVITPVRNYREFRELVPRKSLIQTTTGRVLIYGGPNADLTGEYFLGWGDVPRTVAEYVASRKDAHIAPMKDGRIRIEEPQVRLIPEFVDEKPNPAYVDPVRLLMSKGIQRP